MRRKIKEQIAYMEFMNREHDFRHSNYEEEMRIYRHIRDGDFRAVEETRQTFRAERQGHLSDEPLTNMKYLFVASMTLVVRFVITGGMNSETAYTASDYYIQQMDRCRSVEEVSSLHEEAIEFFTDYMVQLKKEKIYSKTVMHCMNYISCHLNRPVCVTEIAAQVKRNPDYLSSLFKKETGKTISEYVMESRLQAARNMLLDSDCSCAEVSAAFGFSSQSYFAQCFLKSCGLTASAYRKSCKRKAAAL